MEMTNTKLDKGDRVPLAPGLPNKRNSSDCCGKSSQSSKIASQAVVW